MLQNSNFGNTCKWFEEIVNQFTEQSESRTIVCFCYYSSLILIQRIIN